MRNRAFRPVMAAFLSLTLVAAACGDDQPEPDSAEPDPVESDPVEPDPAESDPVQTDAESAETESVDDAVIDPMDGMTETTDDVEPDTDAVDTEDSSDVLLELEVVDGAIVGGVRREEASLGDTVRIQISGNSDDEVHVHGYDLHIQLADSGGSGELVFDAVIPGRFEIELEGNGQLLVELTVS